MYIHTGVLCVCTLTNHFRRLTVVLCVATLFVTYYMRKGGYVRTFSCIFCVAVCFGSIFPVYVAVIMANKIYDGSLKMTWKIALDL